MHFIYDPEAFGSALEAAHSEEEGAELDVLGNGLRFSAAFGELGEVYLENGIQLLFNVTAGLDEGVGLCRHVEGDGLYVR